MSLGRQGEDKACEFLRSQGLVLLERNWSVPAGEIDLIMRDGEFLVFVEVKYRSSSGWGHPLEAVDNRKQRKLRQLARVYITMHGLNEVTCRFDVVGILQGEISWVKGAF